MLWSPAVSSEQVQGRVVLGWCCDCCPAKPLSCTVGLGGQWWGWGPHHKAHTEH